jgi:hypothetical protein
LFDYDDLKLTVRGKLVEEKLTDNSSLNVSKNRTHTLVKEHIDVIATGGTPDAYKVVGKLDSKGKFVPDKGTTASTKKAAPKKTTTAKKAPAKKATKKK